MGKSKKTPVPEGFRTEKEAAEFWDSHDLGEYWSDTDPASFRVEVEESPRYVAVEEKIAKRLVKIARKKGVSPETLVNLWVSEKLSKTG